MNDILQTSDLKRRTGKILDAAVRRPQFITRKGRLFQLSVTILTGNPPAGYYADAYPLPAERRVRESAAGRIRQIPER